MSLTIAPSLLSCDFGRLHEEVSMIQDAGADWLHCDIMDGQFVPNISFGIPVLKSIKQQARVPVDVHLMILRPDYYIRAFADAGADILTVHYEAVDHLHRCVNAIREEGMKAGVAINPHTPVESLFDILEEIDLVCLMSVNPGFGGQKFIYRSLAKVKKLKQRIIEDNANVKIEVDGGVGLQNFEKLVEAGMDVAVAGSAIFKSRDPADVIARMKSYTSHTSAV